MTPDDIAGAFLAFGCLCLAMYTHEAYNAAVASIFTMTALLCLLDD